MQMLIKKRNLVIVSLVLVFLAVPFVYGAYTGLVMKSFGVELWISNIGPVIVFDNSTSFMTSGDNIADPIEGNYTLVWFVFNITDANGEDDINETDTFFNLTLGTPGDRQNRANMSCINVSKIGADNKVVFNCSVYLWYYDNTSSFWVINATGYDQQGSTATNDSVNFTFNELSAMALTNTSLNFSVLSLGAQNQQMGPLVLNNTGNDDFDQINISADHLWGVSDSSKYIGVGNFTVNSTNKNAGLGMPLNSSAGQTLLDGENTGDLALSHGHTSSGTSYSATATAAKGNQSLYFWVDVPSTGLIQQKYNNTWNITVIDNP